MPREEKKVSAAVEEFSRFAHQYDHYNEIQAQVAKALVSKLSLKGYNTILDVGCGSGEVFRNLQKETKVPTHFIAFDSSRRMLSIHPQTENVTKVCADFNDKNFLDTLPLHQYDLVLSSSALQWSKDIDFTLGKLSQLSSRLYAAIFTSGTFKTLHRVAGVSSPIYSVDILQKEIKEQYRETSFTVHRYSLDFDSVREMFQYIKKSGVSGGEKQLGYTQMKQLMHAYPLDYLEFEVLFVEARN